MTSMEFAAGNWIDRLAPALRKLAEAQEPYLQEYWQHNPREHVVVDGRDETPFPLDDLQALYLMGHHGNASGEQEYYAPLCAALDPVRYILRSHPTLERVVSRIIGRDEFWMKTLSSGSLTSLTNLIAGLMARAAELSGERFRVAAGELNAFLTPAGEVGLADVLGRLDVGYDAVLFYGLTLEERIEITDGMAMLPFEQVRAFVDQNMVRDLAPPGAVSHGWRSVGAVVRPFRWRPVFRRTGYLEAQEANNPGPFFRQASTFLQVLAVAHTAPVLRLATLPHCIHRSAGRLLGRMNPGGSFSRGRSAQEFNGWEKCPDLAPEALAAASEAFADRKSERFGKMAPVMAWLCEALEGDGRFAAELRFVHVAKALERMYDLPERRISHTLQNRVSRYLGTDAESRERLKQSVKAFYDERSASVHNRKGKPYPQRNRDAFAKGFDIAKRTLFKLLDEGPPNNCDESEIAGQLS